MRALDLLGDELASSSRQRALSTLRGFCGYLVRRGLLTANPCDAPELAVRSETGVVVQAFRREEVDDLIAAAAAPPPSNVRTHCHGDVVFEAGPQLIERAPSS